MATRVLFRHGPQAGQIVSLEDDVYAQTLLQSGYALVAPPEEDVGALEVRETELHEMSAAEVRAIAKEAGVEGKTKADNTENILQSEFPA